MGLREKAEKILSKSHSAGVLEQNQCSGVAVQAEGLYKRCITYISQEPETEKKTADSTVDSPNKPVQFSIDDIPLLAQPFAYFEQFATEHKCDRCLIAALHTSTPIDADTAVPVVLCKGFDFTTENRFRLPYRFFAACTDQQPFIDMSDKAEMEFCKGFVSSTEYRALQRMLIVKIQSCNAWFVAVQSTLNSHTPDFDALKRNCIILSQQFSQCGIPGAQFIPAAVITNSEQRIQQLISAAIVQHKECLLLKLSARNLITACTSFLPSNYERSIFLEIASHIKKAAGNDNIVHCTDPDTIKAGIFTTGMTDPDLYMMQLNKSFAQTAGVHSELQLTSFKISSDAAEIYQFVAQS